MGTVAVLVEIPAIGLEEGHHLAQRGFEGRVQATGFDVNELRGELRQLCLEPKTVLQKALCVTAHCAVAQEPENDDGPEDDHGHVDPEVPRQAHGPL